MNARNQLYVARNSKRSKNICHSKYATKILMLNEGIQTAEVFGILATIEDVNEFNWKRLNKDFVLKPTNGHGGKGVVAFKKKLKAKDQWLDIVNGRWSLDDLKLHCYDILEGQYSSHGAAPKIIIEERVVSHSKLLEYSYKGTPDIRVLIFNSIPIMAYMRLPTRESGGRANQNQGALGVGIDIGSGLTTYAAAHKTHLIKHLPDTNKELKNIQIPYWKKTLLTAVEAANTAKLIYSGVDLFIHKNKGPMVVELNYRPGLSIQIANQAGLRKRLQRVEDLNVLNPEHGVRIGQALFAQSYFETPEEKLTIVHPKENVIVYGDDNKSLDTLAFIKTGRYKSAIASNLGKELGLIDIDDFLWFQNEAGEGRVPVVEVELDLGEQRISATMLVSKRLNRTRHDIELGRKDLPGFLIKTEEK
ncbi:MAG: sugar-transfer associated ATP-grasp domain-containing protein [Patescibacteria group bacterium]|nr:sugar-transfer associated ATP-grasp domain-containing protein [Patescibacteria group bacterium]